jgi:hypothetical protein
LITLPADSAKQINGFETNAMAMIRAMQQMGELITDLSNFMNITMFWLF